MNSIQELAGEFIDAAKSGYYKCDITKKMCRRIEKDQTLVADCVYLAASKAVDQEHGRRKKAGAAKQVWFAGKEMGYVHADHVTKKVRDESYRIRFGKAKEIHKSIHTDAVEHGDDDIVSASKSIIDHNTKKVRQLQLPNFEETNA